jgi:hypothetical protein
MQVACNFHSIAKLLSVGTGQVLERLKSLQHLGCCLRCIKAVQTSFVLYCIAYTCATRQVDECCRNKQVLVVLYSAHVCLTSVADTSMCLSHSCEVCCEGVSCPLVVVRPLAVTRLQRSTRLVLQQRPRIRSKISCRQEHSLSP